MSKAIIIVKINSKLKSKLTKEVSLDGADHINANKLIKKNILLELLQHY